jgi:transcriptional regulator with XRE-family HTH domain
VHTLETSSVPVANEPLAQYVRRQRTILGLTQKDLAAQTGIHVQSLGKIERGKTTQLNRHTRSGLADAFGIPVDYLEKLGKGRFPPLSAAIKVCSRCWMPGTPLDPIWLDPRSKFCFICGSPLQDRCGSCNEPITSIRHRFCPQCGKAYRAT